MKNEIIIHGTTITGIYPQRKIKTSVERERKILMKISRDLGYPEKVRYQLKNAESLEELMSIMQKARIT